MEPTLQKLLSTLVFLYTILQFQSSSSGQECPYPCFPPPTGAGNNPTTTITPPSPPQGGAAVYPPPASIYNPPGGGVIPYLPPPAGGGDGDGVSGVTPSPPEPMVTWFPYYFKRPPHPVDSPAIALLGSLRTAMIAVVFVVFSMCSVLY